MGASLYPEVEEVNRELEIPIQLYDQVREIRDVSETKLIGGQRRQLKILPDPARMAALHVDPIGLIRSLERRTGSCVPGASPGQTPRTGPGWGSF